MTNYEEPEIDALKRHLRNIVTALGDDAFNAAVGHAPMRLVGGATVGSWFGVEARTVSAWRTRYGPESAHPCPHPNGTISTVDGEIPGWFPHRRAEWEAWKRDAPGLGWRGKIGRNAS